MAFPGSWTLGQVNSLQGTRFVKGYEGALSTPCMSGRTLLMDEDDPVFYVKEITGNGNQTIKSYRFEEIEQPKQPEYVTRDELEGLMRRYESAVSRLESIVGADSVAGDESQPEPSEG